MIGRHSILVTVILALVLLATAQATASDPFEFLSSMDGVHQSQVFVQADGSLLLVWVHKGPFDHDLFVARQVADGEFSHPW